MIEIGNFLPQKFFYFFSLEDGCYQIANANIVLSIVTTLLQVIAMAAMSLLCVSETSQCIQWPTPTIIICCFLGTCLALTIQVLAKFFKNGVDERQHKSMYWFMVWLAVEPAVAITAITMGFLIDSWILTLIAFLLLPILVYTYLCTFSLYRKIKVENKMDGSYRNEEEEYEN